MSQLLELKVENTFEPSGPVVSISGQTSQGSLLEPVTLSI